MALRAFEKVTRAHGPTEFARKAKLETAKTLHDMKSFKRSLGVLKALQSEQPDMVYETPDIMLYFGYNYYELGKLEAARDAFSQVINYFPDDAERDLVLARIADTYREDGLEDKAAKLYSLVARTYPESEAGIISLLRLAEIAEKQEARQPLVLKEAETSPRTTKTASQIYRQIVETYPDSPLSQVAMLKLAGLQKREQEYEKAIGTLTRLLDTHPETQLRDNVDKVMQEAMLELAAKQREEGAHEASVDTIAEMLADHPESRLTLEVRKALENSFSKVLHDKNRISGAEAAISYFEKRKKGMPIAQMPSVLLEIGMAYKELHLCEPAISALVAARRLHGENDLPARFLWALSECSYREGNHKLAKDVLPAFVSNHPEHAHIAKAHLWLAELFLADSQFGQTLTVCESGLEKTADSRMRSRFLSVMAKAHNGMGDHQEALGPLNEVLDMLESDDGDVSEIRFNVYKELGRSYFRLGQTERAVEAFERALQLRPEGSHGHGLKFEIARCYRFTAPIKAQGVLRDIVASGDPFWSKVAQARINEIDLEQSVDRLGLNKSG
jgi:TolA-binding protein